MQTHVKVLAVIMLVFGTLGALTALLLGLAFGGAAAITGISGDADAALAAPIIGITGTALTIFILVMSLPGLIAGWGLLKLKPWARILAIVVCAVNLINFPVGTLVGAYGLWVLLNAETQRLFETAGAGTHPTTV